MGSRDPEPAVTVTVVRSGGFAGIPRRWQVAAPAPEADLWITLVEQCPWDRCPPAREDASPKAGEPDRFSWTLHALLADTERAGAAARPTEHRATLTETEASGPWRALIDAVRAAAAPAPPLRRPDASRPDPRT